MPEHLYASNPDSSPKPPRKTVHNLLRLIGSRNFSELNKVIRRRSINLFRFVYRIIRRIFLLLWEFSPWLRLRQRHQMRKLQVGLLGIADTTESLPQVGLIIRDADTHPTSSAFIRLLAPLTRKSMLSKFSIVVFSQNNVKVQAGIKLYIVQRNAFDDEETASKFVYELRSNGSKLIVDTDDAFSSINPDHIEHSIHAKRSSALSLLLDEADQIWVSTKTLKETSPKPDKTIIIPNTLDDRLWAPTSQPRAVKPNSPLQILYMGTGTHNGDLAMITPALDKLDTKYPDSFKLTVIGVASALPERDWLRRIHFRRGQTLYPVFVRKFLNKGPFDLGLAPLVDNKFNGSKSDIKCLDYIAAGVVPIVSDCPAYQDPALHDFVIKVPDSTDVWFKTLAEIVSNPSAFRAKAPEMVAAGQKYIWSKRSTDTAADTLERQIKLATGK